MTKALIIGGGIAGSVTAIALHKAGIDSVVYEAQPADAAAAGAFLTIGAHGLDVLRVLDADKLVIDNSFAASTSEVYGANGQLLNRVDFGGPTLHTLTRDSLFRLLHEEVTRRGIRIVYGKRIADAMTMPDDSVAAAFTDGTTANGDLLIGADGLRSTVRDIIDLDAPRPRYAGFRTICGRAKAEPEPAPSYRVAYGRAFFCHTGTPDGQTWWYANVRGLERGRSRTPAQWRERLAALLAPRYADIVRASDDAIVATTIYDLATVPVWHARSMIVIGDAAHAATPNAGQGATMAIEDGVQLARCLRDLPNVRHAFVAFESLRRERVERVVALSAGMARSATPSLPRRLQRNFTKSKGRARNRAGNADWLNSYSIDWDARVSP